MTQIVFKPERINHCFTKSSLATDSRPIQEATT
jgi:hypothetical protein